MNTYIKTKQNNKEITINDSDEIVRDYIKTLGWVKKGEPVKPPSNSVKMQKGRK